MLERHKEEQERNFMLANDDRYLTQLAEAMRQPNRWLLMQLRADDGHSFLDTFD